MIIKVPSFEIWEYFQQQKEALRDAMFLIASNENYGVEIYLTNEDDFPYIVVNCDDDTVYEEAIMSESGCQLKVSNIYSNYLSDKIVDTIIDGFPDDDDDDEYDPTDDAPEDPEDLIEFREVELDDAFIELLAVILDGEDVDDAVINDVKEHTLEYAARKHGLTIYRPMILEDDDGEFFEEFPYEFMEFDDEDNPIYK